MALPGSVLHATQKVGAPCEPKVHGDWAHTVVDEATATHHAARRMEQEGIANGRQLVH
jgi:hypothetical protein